MQLSQPSTLVLLRVKWSSLVASPVAGEAQAPTHSLLTDLVPILHWGQGCSFYPLKNSPITVQGCAETSLDARLSQSLSCMWVVVEVSVLHGLQDCSQEWLEVVHRPVQGLTLGPSVCQWPNAPVDNTPPGSFGIWCWMPQFPLRHFCS